MEVIEDEEGYDSDATVTTKKKKIAKPVQDLPSQLSTNNTLEETKPVPKKTQFELLIEQLLTLNKWMTTMKEDNAYSKQNLSYLNIQLSQVQNIVFLNKNITE